MSIIIRRINIGKWKDYAKTKHKRSFFASLFNFPKHNAPGDAITQCLKTCDNELSIWVVEKEEDVPLALLAMATGIKQDSLGTIHYLKFKSEELNNAGIEYEKSIDDAGTAVSVLKTLHHDIQNVGYNVLGKIQDMIVEKVQTDQELSKIPSELLKLIKVAIDGGFVDYNMLSEKYNIFLAKKFPARTNYSPDSDFDKLKKAVIEITKDWDKKKNSV